MTPPIPDDDDEVVRELNDFDPDALVCQNCGNQQNDYGFRLCEECGFPLEQLYDVEDDLPQEE